MYSSIVFIALIGYIIFLSFDKNSQGFSKDYTKTVSGLLTLLIISNHLIPTLKNHAYLSEIFYNIGAPTVAIFFFISGYGTSKNLRNENYKKNFIKNKIINLVIPYIIANIIYSLVYIIFGSGNFNFNYVIEVLKNGQLIVSFSWYIIALIYLYLISYVSSFIKNNKLKQLCLTFCIILYFIVTRFLFNWTSNWYITYIAYPFGMIIENKNKKINIKIKYLLISICIFVVTYISALYLILKGDTTSYLYIAIQFISSIFICAFIFLNSCKYSFSNTYLHKINQYGLEIYLYHGLFIQIFQKIKVIYNNNYIYILSVYIASIIFSIILNRGYKYFIRLFNNLLRRKCV